MVFPIKFSYNPAKEMATLTNTSAYSRFRFFTTGRDYASEPQFDLSANPMACDAEPCNKWLTVEEAKANNNDYLSNFSAVCFLTIRDIARMHTNNRPVALIASGEI